MTRRDLLTLAGGMALIGAAQWAILHRPTPPRHDSSFSAFADSLTTALRADSVRLAKWTDSIASMPPDTLREVVTRYVRSHRTDTLIMVAMDTVTLPAQVVRELATSDSTCRVRVDSLRGELAIDSVRARIDSMDRRADLAVVRRERWTWAGWGFLGGVVVGLGACR